VGRVVERVCVRERKVRRRAWRWGVRRGIRVLGVGEAVGVAVS